MRRFGLGLQLALLVSCGVASGYAWRAALVPKRTAVRVVPATVPYEPAPLTRMAPRPQSAPTHTAAVQTQADTKPHPSPHAQAAKKADQPAAAETAAAVTPSHPVKPRSAEAQPQSPPPASSPPESPPPPHPSPPSHKPTPPPPPPPAATPPPASPNLSSKKAAQAARKAEYEREKAAKKAAQAARKAEFEREKQARKQAKQAAKAAKKAQHAGGDLGNDGAQASERDAEGPKQNDWSSKHGPKNK